MATHKDVEYAERQCVSLVVNRGMKLKFALIQSGLKYKANTPNYHRIRRKVCQEKEKRKQKKGKIINYVLLINSTYVVDIK